MLALPPSTPSTIQITFELLVPLTLAVNCCVLFGLTVVLEGEIETTMEDGAVDPALPAVGVVLPIERDPPQPENESAKTRSAEIEKGVPNLHDRLTMPASHCSKMRSAYRGRVPPGIGRMTVFGSGNTLEECRPSGAFTHRRQVA